jgi:phosphoribosylformylglycinamidine cyclo-ligase
MKPVTYAAAGVDISAADRAKQRIKGLARVTFNRNTLAEIGGFGGLFRLPDNLRRPVLVSSVDGVGTKLKVAFMTGVHDTVGRDLVNHCVNDILVQGASPLFFLDYVAVGRLDPAIVCAIVEGVSRGCRENGCVLIGGETAEMPGFYAPGEYDVAGCIVGVVEENRIVTGAAIRPGDRLLGLGSAGLHTNGYSLARHLLFDVAGYDANNRVAALGTTVGEALLAEHRSYLGLIGPLLKKSPGLIHGMAHVTGGGITENLPRVLPPRCAAEIDAGSWDWPPIFKLIQQIGGVPLDDMRRTFNLGIGMILVVAADDAAKVTRMFARRGERAMDVGRIVSASGARQPRVRYV